MNDQSDHTDPADQGEPTGPTDTPAEPSAGSTPPAETPQAPAAGATPPPAPPTPTPGAGPSNLPAQPQTGGMSGQDQRNWGMAAHLSAFAGSFLLGLAPVGPLLVWLLKKDEDEFVAEHSREALNFHTTWFLGGIVGGILAVIVGIVTIGLGLIILVPVGIGLFIAWVWFTIKGAIAASKGEYYRYPLSVRLVT